jgi:hypothetical protein
MFEVGDKVVCVDDGHYVRKQDGATWPFQLTKGDVFTVRAVYPPGMIWHTIRLEDFKISIGVESIINRAACEEIGICAPHFDIWKAARFRKLRDISQSLAELKALTISCPPLVEA